MNQKFDLDLRFGQEGEQWLKWLGTNEAKIEVKRERDLWFKTGNIFFETKCSGKPSGINVTTADYWAIILTVGNQQKGVLIFPVPQLKRGLKQMLKAGTVKKLSGGDDNRAEGVIVPIGLLNKIFAA